MVGVRTIRHRCVVRALFDQHPCVPLPCLVDRDGFAVGNDGPDRVEIGFVGEVEAEDEWGGHDAPRGEVRSGLSEGQWVRVARASRLALRRDTHFQHVYSGAGW